MTHIYLFCIASVIISCVSSQFEDQYPPIFSEPTTNTPHVKEGNYTDNPICVFSIGAWVQSPRLNVSIHTVQSEETSSLISKNCTPIQNSHSNITCTVYLMAFVDRERTQSLVFKFFANSSNTNVQIQYKSVTLILDDINDESPVFDPPSYQILLPENFKVNSTVTNVDIKATDPDTGTAGQVFYSIMSSGQASNLYNGYFDISSSNGDLVLKKELDYETLTFLQYTIIATDGGHGNPTHNSTAELLVKVEDVQDKPPVFLGLPYVKNFPENVSGVILHVQAIDGDLGIPRKVVYGNLNGSCAQYLIINETGFISTAPGTNLDRDSGEISLVRGVCFIEIEAYEEGTEKTNITCSTTSFALTVDDINDNAPNFTKPNYTGSVDENAKISISFDESIVVKDIDQNNHNNINLTVHYPNMTIYSGIDVSPSTITGNGIVLLRVINPFDYEEQKFVDLVLKAVDAQDSSLSSTCSIHIEIHDTNDNDPQFNFKEYYFNVSENSCKGTIVGVVIASDMDSGHFGNVSYQISGTNTRFAINTTNGEIFVATDKGCNCTKTECDDSDLNWEKNPVFFLTAVAQDGGGSRSPVSVEIHLLDINDNAPQFIYSKYETSIKENSTTFSSGEQQIFVQATDRDEINSPNSNISYCLVDDNDTCINHIHFHINQSGAVSCIKELDYEELSVSSRGKAGELRLRIKACDHGNSPLCSTVTLTTFVQDENDNNPTFNQTHKGSVKENSGIGTSVLTVSAYDADGTAPNNEISYFIFSGGSDQFSMDGSSGVISVQHGAMLDTEIVPKYDITVIAIDRGNPQRTGTTNVTVDVLDVNDTPPRYLNLPNEQKVQENETEKVVFNVSCIDNDTDSELEYIIQVAEVCYIDRKANDSELVNFKNYFVIDKSTGVISSSPKVDAETVKRVVLNVTVVDIKTASTYENSTMAQLTLSITDKNDNPPIFLQKSLSAGILRDSGIRTVVFDLKEKVSDADSSVENRIHTFYFNVYKDLDNNKVGSGCSHSFCVTINGTVYSNVLFTGRGYAKINITVNDTAGTDYTILDIYVIDESQQLSMHFLMQTNAVYQVKDTVLKKLSQVLGYKCVFDKIEQFMDNNNNLKEHESLLTFHVLDEPTNTVLEAASVESLLDKRGDSLKGLRDEFAVQAIGALTIKDPITNENKIKETYILVAVIVLLALILGIIIYFYIVSNTRFKRKLKAATIPTAEKNKDNLGQPYLPGSNIFSSTKNPLVDKDDEVKRRINDLVDRASLAGSENSLDYNEVEYAKRNRDNDNPVEEKEVTMDMYGDDDVIQNDSDDDLMLLKQAVKQHEKTAPVSHDMDCNDRFDVMNGKVNESYEIVESTDV
uniref:Cadherin domain-containing protein n=1 Tax=Magallana gigas TaxID=29159 RepID=A0A8W8N826_MAGGI|nr:cadherin-23 [Crassostrea gigas]XP_034311815.1 cadherin-23 [Crassostrea gigas]XP_034311816.1 cadherin-23 [Crassostrea gigas]XP_034311818.1 cadherin-23 [Crassostrea gigas]